VACGNENYKNISQSRYFVNVRFTPTNITAN
jgi:hypothetical protein